MQHYGAFHLGLHCLPKYLLRDFEYTKGKATYADPKGGGGAGVRTHLKNNRNIGFLSNTGPDLQKNHKATKLAFNVWPSSARSKTPFNCVLLAGR